MTDPPNPSDPNQTFVAANGKPATTLSVARLREAGTSADAGAAKKRGLLSRIHTFDSLSIRDFRLLWLGQVDTSLGQWMDNISRTYLIYHITSSPLQLGLAAAARGIPLFLFGIVAGALADRSSRKMQLIVAQVTNAVLNLIL